MKSLPTRNRAALIPALLLPGFASLFYFILIPESSAARIIYGTTKLFTLLWPILAIRFLLAPASIPRLKSSWKGDRRDVLAGMTAGVLMALTILAAFLSPAGSPVIGATDLIRRKAALLGMLDAYIPTALVMSLIHSAVEEYYWRWFVFECARSQMPTRAAHLIAGLAFAFHHIVVTIVYFGPVFGLLFGLAVGFAGMIWSVMYQLRGSLISPWIAHVCCDLAIFAIGYHLIV